MIHITKSTYIPRVEETLGTLKMHNSMMPIFVDFDKIMMDISYLQFRLEAIGKELFPVIGKPTTLTGSDNMKHWLYENEDVSAFDKVETGISLDKDSIAKAVESGSLTPFGLETLQLYQKYSYQIKMRSKLASLLQNPMSNGISCDGHRMLILNPIWAAQNTGRVAMKNPDVQNFHHEIQEIVTVPKGYVKYHVDSGQIEPRIIYSAFIDDKQIQALIKLYNDAYYGVLHYITMDESFILSGTTTFTPRDITDEMKEQRALIKRHTNSVMYGSTSNPSGDSIKAAMIKRIGNHPKRRQWLSNLQYAINHGQRIFKTAFGTEINISLSQKLNDGNLRAASIEEELLRLAINNPIQATAADLMRVSVSEANKILSTKSKKSYISMYVHDAGEFAVHEDEMHILEKDLSEIVAYDVDGWIPIYAEPEVGRKNGINGLIPDLY